MKTLAVTAIKFPAETQKAIRRAAEETQLSQADVIRQSVRIGLPEFVARFPKPQKAALVPAGK